MTSIVLAFFPIYNKKIAQKVLHKPLTVVKVQSLPTRFFEMRHYHLQNDNYHSTASLRELTTVPPMSSKQHEENLRQRQMRRQRVEDMKDEAEMERNSSGYYS